MRSRPAARTRRGRSEGRARPVDGASRRAAAAPRDAHVRGVELADHEVQQPAHLVRRPRAGDARRVRRRARRPSPCRGTCRRRSRRACRSTPARNTSIFSCAKSTSSSARHRDRARLARLDGDDRDAALLEVEDLPAVRRELRVALGAGRRRELPRHGRLARELVERIDVEVLLPRGGRRQQQRLAVGADRLRCRRPRRPAAG